MLKGALAPETLAPCAEAFRRFVASPVAHHRLAGSDPRRDTADAIDGSWHSPWAVRYRRLLPRRRRPVGAARILGVGCRRRGLRFIAYRRPPQVLHRAAQHRPAARRRRAPGRKSRGVRSALLDVDPASPDRAAPEFRPGLRRVRPGPSAADPAAQRCRRRLCAGRSGAALDPALRRGGSHHPFRILCRTSRPATERSPIASASKSAPRRAAAFRRCTRTRRSACRDETACRRSSKRRSSAGSGAQAFLDSADLGRAASRELRKVRL